MASDSVATVTAETTLVILLGASAWPKSPNLGVGESFANSAHDFRAYLLRVDGFRLPQENLLDLFDDERTPSEMDEKISKFLHSRISALKERGTPARDLLLYYVGHGGFAAGDSYFLAIRATRQSGELTSGLQIAALANTLLEGARGLRRFLVLDCCFSATAYTEFQAAPLEVARIKTLERFPERGTALLCSSGARDPSRAPQNAKHTMFSGAFLSVLEQGDHSLGASLSLRELGILVTERIRNQYPDDAVRPEVHSPDQRKGDIATVPVFPNAAHRSKAIAHRFNEFESRLNALEGGLALVEKQRVRLEDLERRFESLAQSATASRETEVASQAVSDSGRYSSAESRHRQFNYGIPLKRWERISPRIRSALAVWWRAKLAGLFWLYFCAGVSVAGLTTGFYIQAFQIPPTGLSVIRSIWIISFSCMIVIAGVAIGSVIMEWLSEGSLANPLILPSNQGGWWEKMDAIVEMRSGKVRRLFLVVPIEGSRFWIGTVIVLISLILLAVGTKSFVYYFGTQLG